MTRLPHWIQKGLKFACTQCGACCKGPDRAVWVNEMEVQKLAQLRKLDVQSFIQQFTEIQPTNRKWLLKKAADGISCIFLTAHHQCSVHRARPTQCATYPFWPEHLISELDWKAEGLGVCEGIEHVSGAVYHADKVLLKLCATELDRHQENFDLDLFHEYLQDPSCKTEISEYGEAFWKSNQRKIKMETARVLIVDTTLNNKISKRSLLFKSTPHFVQSEMSLSEENGELVTDPSEILQRPYHLMLLGMVTMSASLPRKHRVGIIGAGGGALARYLHHHSTSFPVEIDAIDVDPEVLEVGKEWFEFHEEQDLRIHCEDGLEYLQSAAMESFDWLLIDVADQSIEGSVEAPPDNFHSEIAVQLYWTKLKQSGMLSVNVIGGAKKLQEMEWSIKRKFSFTSAIHLPWGAVYFAWKTPLASSFSNFLHSTISIPPLLRSFFMKTINEVDLYHDRYAKQGYGWWNSMTCKS